MQKIEESTLKGLSVSEKVVPEGMQDLIFLLILWQFAFWRQTKADDAFPSSFLLQFLFQQSAVWLDVCVVQSVDHQCPLCHTAQHQTTSHKWPTRVLAHIH